MKVFDANITPEVLDFLTDSLMDINSFSEANFRLYNHSKILDFFASQIELDELKEQINSLHILVEEPDRTEYGDFQTNENLAKEVIEYLSKKSSKPHIIVEPTCGKGSFIVASLSIFDTANKIYGIEIYKPYLWETKFNILYYYLHSKQHPKTEIHLVHDNVFDFNFRAISKHHYKDEILVIGNPPWVTNAKLGRLNSNNLPEKSNFKKYSGLDALTGKGNFDIGESITLMMLDAFQHNNGHLALLLKNSVVRNIVFDQMQREYRISEIEKLNIDSKKEFNASVEASLLFCTLNSESEYSCHEFNFYTNVESYNSFGWINNKFVSNIRLYQHSKDIDGICPFEWRQGIKHDCSNIMELEKIGDHYVNGFGEDVNLEDEMVYALLKSSDLKDRIISQTRKFTILTQKKIGQETSYIKREYPKTFDYLNRNRNYFVQRKSSIYKDKPLFSIFGIGDYSFKPYKVAISGLYKNYSFNLILPQKNKPIMLDDTCYFLGFDRLDFAVFAFLLLNSSFAEEFLKAITFPDAKRTFTKEVLMRIDILHLSNLTTKEIIQSELKNIKNADKLNISFDSWDDFIGSMNTQKTNQIKMFV